MATLTLHLKCQACPQEHQAYWTTFQELPRMDDYLRATGWVRVSGRMELCPACSADAGILLQVSQAEAARATVQHPEIADGTNQKSEIRNQKSEAPSPLPHSALRTPHLTEAPRRRFTDEQILSAFHAHPSKAAAARSLEMAPSQFSGRLNLAHVRQHHVPVRLQSLEPKN